MPKPWRTAAVLVGTLLAAVLTPALPAAAATVVDPRPVNLVGSFDSASFVPGDGIVLSGWVVDTTHPTDTSSFVDVSWTTGSKSYDHAVECYNVDQPRPDVARAYPSAGPDHGFRCVIGFLAVGTYHYCLSANAGKWGYGGADSDKFGEKPLGCHSVTMTAEKVTGAIESFGPNPSGPGLVFSGWSADSWGEAPPYTDDSGTHPMPYDGRATLTVTPDSGASSWSTSVDFSSATTPRTDVPGSPALGFSGSFYGVSPAFPAATYKLCVGMSFSIQAGEPTHSIGCTSQHLLAFDQTDTYTYPADTGAAHLGAKVTASSPASALTPAPTATGVQWVRDDLIYSDPNVVGRSASYTVQAADVGHRLASVAWAAKAGYVSAAYLGDPARDPGTEYVTIAGVTTSRVAGADRYATAIALSKQRFPSSGTMPSTVYLASGTAFPDALSAGPAAAQAGAPILLTTPQSLPANVATELKRLHPKTIVIVGGPKAVSAAVATATARIAHTVRVYGVDRYATSNAVAAYAFPHGAPGAYVVSGAAFPDALSAGPAAGAAHEPILLTTPGPSSTATAVGTELRKLGAKKATIVGGTAAVSSAVQAVIAKAATTTRLAGADRDATALAVAASFSSAPAVYLASDQTFPDGLSASAAGGHDGAPLLVLPEGCVPTSVITRIAALKATRVVIMGGTSAVSENDDKLTACD